MINGVYKKEGKNPAQILGYHYVAILVFCFIQIDTYIFIKGLDMNDNNFTEIISLIFFFESCHLKLL